MNSLSKFAFLIMSGLVLSFSNAAFADVLPSESLYQVKSKWRDQEGKILTLDRLRGKNTVISMVYMSCKFSCPLTVTYMKEIIKELPESAKDQVQFVLVSFDPKRDTSVVMNEYMTKQKLASSLFPWTFMTSDLESDIRELSALLDFKYKKLGDGEFEHSFAIIALDKDGVIKGRIEGVDQKASDLIKALELKK